ncbi:MAG: 16S rRNA (uracil(1498)-N(3))-methyltransferase [Bacteroidales bacterium]|nr:16S rRNA (uracil(1498)-N(3))-methyltransferase [Bacteroidales bacterium]
MPIFYDPTLSPTATHHTLNEEESWHCVKVLRMGAGQPISLIDGRGTLYEARIESAHPARCQVSIEQTHPNHGHRNVHVHIAIAPPKNIERLEWCIEKCTEIGIDSITPLLCERSERREVKPERLQRVMVAAVKQSRKAYMPTLNPMVRLTHFVTQPHSGGLFIAHCNAPSLPPLRQLIGQQRSCAVLIGPEGDFSPHEVAMAEQHGFKSVSLGPSLLRTETAGLVACHLANLMAQ